MHRTNVEPWKFFGLTSSFIFHLRKKFFRKILGVYHSMPLIVPQHMKALSTISLQPEKMSGKIDAIMCMDVAGMKGNDIANKLGLSVSRISIIRNSPMYIAARDKMREDLKEQFVDKRADNLASGDPVENLLKTHALDAARAKIELMANGRSEFVRLAAAGDILDRAGYKASQEKSKVSIEITDKMASRFEEALRSGGRVTLSQEVTRG